MMADIRFRLRSPLLWILGVLTFAAEAHGQTLFARTDTTPNYVSYGHVEECLMAVFRVTEEQERRGKTVWTDTLLVGEWKQLNKELGINNESVVMKSRPDSAIQAGKACLSRFNPDTAAITSAPFALQTVQVLLMARRDQDAQRFTQRLLDTMRLRSSRAYKDVLQQVLDLYASSRPLLYDEVKKYHAQVLATVKGDSLYRSIDADLTFARVAMAVHDTALYKELAWRAIRNNDATSVEERMGSPLSNFRLNTLWALVGQFTQDQGLDSLSKSTLAYNLYRANTVERRVYGGDTVTATDEKVKPYKVPDLLGEYSYAATPGAPPVPSGQGTFTKQGAVPPGALPVKNRLNFITTRPSFCHPEEGVRGEIDRLRKNPKGCVKWYTWLRRLKEQNPDFEIIMLWSTYGTVGSLGPLQPADEADTLAKLFLGHHRVPAHLVVETTPFFRVEAPDERRIDLPTPMMEAFGPVWNDVGRVGLWTDKEGYQVKMMNSPGTEWFNRAYAILKNRPSK